MVEMAVAMPLLLTLLLGFVDFGYLLYQWNAGNKAVQMGAILAQVSTPVASGIGCENRKVPLHWYLVKLSTSTVFSSSPMPVRRRCGSHWPGDRRAIHVDFRELGALLRCVIASQPNSGYGCLLTMMPGNLLVEMYRLHGPRLLERNVRSFLQLKGKVNQVIRKTIHR
ncbi:TadE/TadG family type IV pilus assembly protein [Mesorhizobium sp. M0802]|uniref:TadE/TadG family type IV pilus assembly protein n=1 Tax=Mesorhizobium sp. M0802 TaxID=2957001 RepID=UPI003337AC89